MRGRWRLELRRVAEEGHAVAPRGLVERDDVEVLDDGGAALRQEHLDDGDAPVAQRRVEREAQRVGVQVRLLELLQCDARGPA